MSVSHSMPARNAVAEFDCAQINAGTIVMLSRAGATVATLRLSDKAFRPAINAVARANDIWKDANAIGGTIARTELRNAEGATKLLCSVTKFGGGGDIELPVVDIKPGQTVSISLLEYEAPP